MEVKKITENKKQYIDFLLLADEQESMIDKYLQRGEMFALYSQGLKSICVVTNEDNKTFEIKNIATEPKYQGMGYGKQLISYLFEYYKNKGTTLIVGTGNIPHTILFYQKCGFVISHRIENFFINNYDSPIFECGKQLIDMVYLKKEL